MDHTHFPIGDMAMEAENIKAICGDDDAAVFAEWIDEFGGVTCPDCLMAIKRDGYRVTGHGTILPPL